MFSPKSSPPPPPQAINNDRSLFKTFKRSFLLKINHFNNAGFVLSETVSLTLSFVTIKSVLLLFFPGRALPPSWSITFLITVPDPDLETREEGRGRSSGPWDKGDPVSKMFFSALRALVLSKNKRDGPPGPLPWIRHWINAKSFVKKQSSGAEKTRP